MYFITNIDGIPELTNDAHDALVLRAATREEIQIHTDFWGLFWDRVEAGEPASDELDEDVRRIILTKYGMTDRI